MTAQDTAADQRDLVADDREAAADTRQTAADTRERDFHGSLVWLFGAIVVLGCVIALLIGQVNRKLDEGNKIDKRQAVATENLVTATNRLQTGLDESNKALAAGRYERQKFQAEERALTCLDLQDGDVTATTEQIAQCAKGYIKVPPPPEGYEPS